MFLVDVGGACIPFTPSPLTPPPPTPQLSLEDLQDLVGTLLGVEGPTLDPGAPLASLGLTSTLAVQLVPNLERALGGGTTLPPTLPFDHPTLEDMHRVLQPHPAQKTQPLLHPPPQVSPATTTAHGGVAYVLGSAARLAGNHTTLSTDAMSTDAISTVPLCRWDMDHVLGGGAPTTHATSTTHTTPAARFGGFVVGAEVWDPEPFGITVAEALHMDPQQRLVLDVVSGVGGVGVDEGQCGVFVGISQVWWWFTEGCPSALEFWCFLVEKEVAALCDQVFCHVVTPDAPPCPDIPT